MRCLFIITLCLYSCLLPAQDTAILDGSLSVNATKFNWQQISGEKVTLISPDSIKCQVIINDLGEYLFKLTVSNKCCSRADSTLITVISGPLSINPDTIKVPQREQIKELSVRLDVRNSDILAEIKSPRRQEMQAYVYDITGRLLYQKQFIASTGTNVQSLYKPDATGIYIVRFTSYFDDVVQKVFVGK